MKEKFVLPAYSKFGSNLYHLNEDDSLCVMMQLLKEDTTN